MNIQHLPREVPWHAVIGGLPAGVILRHLDQDQINAVRRTWHLQGLDSYVRALDDALDQLKAAHSSYIRRSNVGMASDPIQMPEVDQEEKVTDPIETEVAAALLGCSVEWVRRLAREGRLVAERHGKRGWIVSRASVLAHRDARTEGAEAA